MRIFYCGDIVARPGREVVLKNLAKIRADYKADVIIANVENAAHGFGVTPGICRDFLEKGADVLVTGNHFLNQRDILPYLNDCKVIIRPANIPAENAALQFLSWLTDGEFWCFKFWDVCLWKLWIALYKPLKIF